MSSFFEPHLVLVKKARSISPRGWVEGRTRQEAAALLGRPEGTVAGRLARARELPAKRLQRFAPATALTAVMAEAASARPPILAHPAPASAAALAQETRSALGRGLIMKFTSIALLALGCAGFGVFLQSEIESVTISEIPAAEANAADADETIIWGREVNGLQAGIAFGDKKTFVAGEQIRRTQREVSAVRGFVN